MGAGAAVPYGRPSPGSHPPSCHQHHRRRSLESDVCLQQHRFATARRSLVISFAVYQEKHTVNLDHVTMGHEHRLSTSAADLSIYCQSLGQQPFSLQPYTAAACLFTPAFVLDYVAHPCISFPL